jgi:1-deoxy-D-xylulose-5-phosphate reductoisomerase
MKNVAILGSTGSIGTSSLEVIQANPERYRVIALAAGRNMELLLKQIETFRPVAAALVEEDLSRILRNRIPKHVATKVFSGTQGFVHLATLPEVDTVVSAMVGAVGLVPSYAAIEAGKELALANKETMVMAGSLVMSKVSERQGAILPIDSEHSAILQSLRGHRREDLRRVILTASGGPFRDRTLKELQGATAQEALRHPTWKMGRKISIDSATLMNKGLESIEAKWLFDLKMDQIGILVHPQSVVHSMVEYRDGSVIAQMGVPDMKTPIAYALSYPNHHDSDLPPLRLDEIGTLSFEKPDMKRFKCLELALAAGNLGGSMPAVMNGANEIAVESFLKGDIGFLDIPVLIEKTMTEHEVFPLDSIQSVLEADEWARRTALQLKRALKG